MTNGILEHEVVEELMGEWGSLVGQRIRKRRNALRLTLDQVASMSGLSKQTIHRAEVDGRTVRDGTRHLIAVTLATEVSELWEPMSAEALRRRAKAVA